VINIKELNYTGNHVAKKIPNFGYSKSELNDFIEYIIKQTEDNIEVLKFQQEEVKRLKKELETYKKLEDTYYHINKRAEENINKTKELASFEAKTILEEAKNNANQIINSALVEASKIENKNITLANNLKLYKKKMRNILIQQLDEVENIEIL